MKTYKPTSPARRQMTTIEYKKFITTNEPYKPLTKGHKQDMARNAFGRITVRHKGGGNKKLYRLVDFIYDKKDVRARIDTVEYDPYRTAFIALATYADGEKRYTVVPKDMKVGDTFIVSENAPIEKGNRLALKNIPVGTFVFNLEIKAGGGAKMIRSAGSFAQVIAQDGGYTQVKMPSTEIRKVIDGAYATIGQVSNDENWLVNIGKAGRSRWYGIRPTVRGSVMNPVDHPKGGGEGRQGRGRRREINVYGKPTGKGQKTRKPKKYSNYLIISRRKVGKNKEVKA